MFDQVLSKTTKQPLALLAESGILKSAYLAGGTALALQIGHRYSYDLDFFTQQKFDQELLVQRITELLPRFKLERKDWGTILAYINSIRFSLFFYKYPLLFKTHQFLGVEIADIKDIALMKIAAITDRGAKRDFIDLYFILAKENILTLKEALRLYDQKFKALEQNKIHILKSLVYFEDAKKDALPLMIRAVDWPSVKRFFVNEQKKLVKGLFHIP